MDIEQLYNDYNIEHRTIGHKHCRPGWVNTECPFCEGNPGYHLGYNLDGNFFVCWRCGGHNLVLTLKYLLKKPTAEVKTIIKAYGGSYSAAGKGKQVRIRIGEKPFKFPTGSAALSKQQEKYLRSRGFDPQELVEDWQIQGTGPVSSLDGADYKNRILIPIFWGGEIVSFQTRSMRKADPVKYKACPQAREKIEHQKILYCREEFLSDSVICVEGVFDTWAFGKEYAFGVFGIAFTPAQLRTISKRFKRVLVVFDSDAQAVEQAKKLTAELRFRGVSADYHILKHGDPAELAEDEIQKIISLL